MKVAVLVISVLAVASFAAARDSPAPTAAPQGIECFVCKQVFSALEGWLASNKTEAEIEKLLDLLCDILPSGAQKTCEKIVDAGVKELIKVLEEAETPAEACREIGACEGPEPVDPIPCQMCVFVMTDIEGWIKDNKTESEIEALIEQICTIMPSILQPTCRKIVDKGVEKIIQMILDAENPRVVCQQLGICKTPTPPKQNGVVCDVCELVFKALEKWIASNKTETEIEKLLDIICDILPSKPSQTCHKIIDVGVKELIKALEAYETPAEACRELGACEGPAPDDSIGCFMCKFVVYDIEQWVEEEKTMEEIIALVDKVCLVLPEGMGQKVCKVIVDDVVEDIIELVIAQETPGVICHGLTLCANVTMA